METSNLNANEAHKSKRLKIESEGSDSNRENEGSSSNECGNVTSSFDFEKHRASFVLKKGEFWAVRDEFGMPRRYVQVMEDGDIHSVKVRFMRNHQERYGYGGFLRAWGKLGGENHEPLDIPCFSHKVVQVEKYNDYDVLPRKGEVWAIRANNADTFFRSPTLIKYQLVEILEDYEYYKGMTVVYLVSVRGGNGRQFRRYESAFHMRPKSVREVISHQVPSTRVFGQKPVDDLLELDPSSLPLYVDDFETNFEHEINDNHLFLRQLDQRVSYDSAYGINIWAAYDHECRVPQKYVYCSSNRVMQELVPILTYDSEKKWQEAGLPIACGKFIVAPVQTERRFILSHRLCTWERNYKFVKGVYHIDMYPKKGEVWGIYKDRNLVMACNSRGPVNYQIVVVTGTTEKDVKVAHLIRVEGFQGIFKKRSDLASAVVILVNEFYRFSHNIPSYRFDENCSEEFLRGVFVLDPFLLPQKHGESYSFNDPFFLERPKVRSNWSAIQYFVNKQRNAINLASQEYSCEESENCTLSLSVEQEEIGVEDSQEGEPNIGEITSANGHASERMECQPIAHDIVHHIKFHDFDDTKSERSIKLGEIWAFFNGVNGLPRSYARIDKFLNSGRMLEVTLLQPHPVAHEEMQWVEANLPMACGTFRVSQSTCIENKLLSHRLICVDEQPSKLFFRVYPRKGEVWAIYRHWNINWTISDMSNSDQYKMVEIVSDFTQEAGVTVASLVQAEAHDNEFRRQLHEGFWLFMAFKGKELLRFSHCIPSLKITGDQGGCTSEGSFRVKFCHNGV